MSRPAKKAAKKAVAKKTATRKKLADKPYDEDGHLLRRMEEQIFHAEDREGGDEDAGEEVSERVVSIALETDGQLAIEAFERDLRPRMHGDRDEEEFRNTLTVPAHAVGRLAYALARDRFKGEWSGEDAFRTFCIANDIPFEDEESRS